MKRKLVVAVLSLVLLSAIGFGAAAFAAELPEGKTAAAERVTAIHQRTDGWEEIQIVFDCFADSVAGNPGGVIGQVAHYLELNGRSLAETLSANGETKVLSSWGTDAYGKRTLVLTLNAGIPREYLFHADGTTLTGGDTLTVKEGLTLPEGQKTAENASFSYELATRNWKRTAGTATELNIVKAETSSPAHIDYVFWFDYAPDALIDNNFMATLGGAFHDVNNPQSPIYFDANNAVWGDNFEFVSLKGQPLTSAAGFQAWWYGNGTSARAFVLRLVVGNATAAPHLSIGDKIIFHTGFHTPEGAVLSRDISFTFTTAGFTETAGGFVCDSGMEMGVNGITEVTLPPAPDGQTYYSFDLYLGVELLGAPIYNLQTGADFADHFILNTKSVTEWGGGSSVQVHILEPVRAKGCHLSVLLVADGSTSFNGLKLDGTDTLKLQKGLRVGMYELREDVFFYNYGSEFGNQWYGESEKNAAESLIAKIDTLTGESSKAEVEQVFDEYNGLSDAQKSLVTNAENLTALVADFEDKDALAADKELLEIGFSNGETAGAVSSDLFLLTEGARGSTIVWESDCADIISVDGIVTMPRGIDSAEVTLTATLTKGKFSERKTFSLTVLSRPYTVTYLDETGAEIQTKEQNADGKFPLLSAPEKPGYAFVAWIAEGAEESFDFEAEVSADVRLKPSYEREEYSIRYELLGGENAAENPESYHIESSTIVLEDASREGYEFPVGIPRLATKTALKKLAREAWETEPSMRSGPRSPIRLSTNSTAEREIKILPPIRSRPIR